MSRAKRDGGTIDWVVMRNRLSNIDARNKRMITKIMEELTRRLGFRLAPGFSERVIFRELFLLGLTVLDVVETGKSGNSLSMSHLAARQEVRDLLAALRIPVIDARITQVRAGIQGDVLTAPRIAPKNATQTAENTAPETPAEPLTTAEPAAETQAASPADASSTEAA